MEYYIKESKKNVWWLCLVFHRGKRSIESGGHATWKLILFVILQAKVVKVVAVVKKATVLSTPILMESKR